MTATEVQLLEIKSIIDGIVRRKRSLRETDLLTELIREIDHFSLEKIQEIQEKIYIKNQLYSVDQDAGS